MSKLISCPDCGRRVSLSASACPGCGAPITARPASVFRLVLRWACFAVAVLALVLAAVSDVQALSGALLFACLFGLTYVDSVV